MAIVERAIILPFSVDASGSILSSNNQATIWQSRVIAAVMTEMGERLFRPDFGGTIKDSLFQSSIDAENMVQESVVSVFSKFLNSLVLDKVTPSIDQQSGVLSITIDYTLPNQDKAQAVLTTATLTRSGDVIQEY
jgi:phage baseplate assembly protein W